MAEVGCADSASSSQHGGPQRLSSGNVEMDVNGLLPHIGIARERGYTSADTGCKHDVNKKELEDKRNRSERTSVLQLEVRLAGDRILENLKAKELFERAKKNSSVSKPLFVVSGAKGKGKKSE
jgi:hypothetical protein